MTDIKTYISKIKLANGTTVYVKDANGRANLTTLLGKHALESLGAAAWKAVATEISGEGLVDASVVKSYVDSQVGQIHSFDVVIDADGGATGPSVAASKDTMYKIYMVADAQASAGTYIEWITIRSGAEGAYTYAWEKIGSTKTDLSGYISNTITIAGIRLNKDISVSELQKALTLGAMAYADKASGSSSIETVDSITMKPVTVAGDAAVTSKTADATLTKANYTPAGKITGSAISGGSINVTLRDAEAATAASITAEAYKPAGSVTSSFVADADNGIAIAGTVSKPTATVTPTTATVQEMKNAGTAYSITEGSVKKATDAKSTFATEGIVATVGSGDDAETLIFTLAGTSDAVTASGDVSYIAPVLSGALPTFGASDALMTGASVEVSQPTFTGNKYAINSTFAGTEVEDMKVTNVTYVKPVIDAATFTGTAATLNFAGTEVKDALVTGVSYDKADATAAFSVAVTPETDVITKTAKTVEIEVSPVAKV